MEIYVAEGTVHTGPFDLEAIKAGLREGRYQPDQLAWYDGAPGWEPISRLPGLEGFLPPPPAPAPAPPPAVVPPAPYPYPPAAPAYYPPDAYAPKRRSPWLLVGGIVVGLAALASGIATMTRGLRSGPARDGSPAPTAAASTPTAAPTASTNVPQAPAATPAAGSTRHFVADRSRYSGNLSTHFVPFSFDYPGDWTVLENVNDEFVEAHRYVHLPNGRDVAVESISFSYAHSRAGTGLASTLPATGSQLLEMAGQPLLSRFSDATKTAPRSGRYGRYPAQEQFITCPADEDDERPDMFFRQAIVARPNNSSSDGVFITALGSTPGGNPNAESLGKSGGLRTIEDSFRFDP